MDAGDQDAGAVDAGAEAAPEPCEPFEVGMTVTKSTRFCAGEIKATKLVEDAALTIGADGVTVTCEGTVIDGAGKWGTVEDYTMGIRIVGRKDVTVRGCTIRGLRYGVVARDASNVVLDGMVLDDNFHDPNADWVQDTVQGGGVRFEGVIGGAVKASSLARNCNAIELRASSGVTVSGNTADHCSNTGAILVDAHDNELSDNDFSWGIRGKGLTFPDAWWGVDTKDSAGMILDAGSSGNRILRNDLTYGGDGLFLRSVIGGCAHDNHAEGNDTSFSPHNAIECWCDGNEFVANKANDSHYGIWTGGMDRGLIRGNEVLRNKVDGMSIQIGEDRHTIIEDNDVEDSGRVGMLLTGRQYQAWHTLGHWQNELANSSHLVVQRNRFKNNDATDVYLTSTRGVVLASNCGADGGAPKVDAGRETDLIVSVGSCGGAEGRSSPVAMLAQPAGAQVGVPLGLDASASAPSPAGGELRFVWLVAPAGVRFSPAVLPDAVWLSDDGGPAPMVTFPAPGLFDVDLFATDGLLAGLATRTVAVAPSGKRVGETAAEWAHRCKDSAGCMTVFADDPEGVDGSAVHVTTNAPFDFMAVTPPARDLSFDAAVAGVTKVGFFVRARNGNGGGWQGNFPQVVLATGGGMITLTPTSSLMPTDPADWVFIEAPVAGSDGWKVTGEGDLADLDAIEIHTDTWGWDPVDVWLDAVTLY